MKFRYTDTTGSVILSAKRNQHYNLSDGILTIDADGPMTDYSYGEAPWYASRDSIRSVVISNSTTTVGSNAFAGLDRVSEVSLHAGITLIRTGAFDCTMLTELMIPSETTTLEDNALTNTASLTVHCERASTARGYCERNDLRWRCLVHVDPAPAAAKEPTCTEEGNIAYLSCTDCGAYLLESEDGYVETEDITLPIEHKQLSLTEAVPATFTQPGCIAYNTCELCGIHLRADNGEVLAENEWIVPPTVQQETVITVLPYSSEFAINTSDTMLYWRVTPEITSTFTFTTTVTDVTGNGDNYGVLYDADGQQLSANDDGGEGNNFLIERELTAGETYYLGIRMYSVGNSGSFRLQVKRGTGWQITEDGILMIDLDGSMPDYATGSAPWYARRNDIRGVSLSSMVTSIGSNAFRGCVNLTEFTVPDGVVRIGSYAFADCVNLSRVSIPDSVNTICTGVFSGCDSLETITLSANVTSLAEDTFAGCTATVYCVPSSATAKLCARCDIPWRCISHAALNSVDAKAEDCWQAGHLAYLHCDDCSVNYRMNEDGTMTELTAEELIVPATNHPNRELFQAQEMTCTEDGIAEYSYCPDCGCYLMMGDSGLESVSVDSWIIPTPGHSIVIDEAVAATCKRSGLTEGSHCERCGEILTEQFVAPATRIHHTEDMVCTECGTAFDFEALYVFSLPAATRVLQSRSLAGTQVQIVIVPERCKTIDPAAFDGCDDLMYIVMEHPVTENPYPVEIICR